MASTPPGIPTSFVPRQPVQPVVRRPQSSGTNIFMVAALILLAAAFIGAGATVAYDAFLKNRLEQKAEALVQAQGQVDLDRVEEFVRLRDRLASGQQLLDRHVRLSQFLDVLERTTLQSVRFSAMTVTVAADNTATINMTGTARNFNALAAQSNAFAGERSIRRAIFSDIALNEARQVSFTLTADLDSRIVTGSGSTGIAPLDTPATRLPGVEAATGTPATATGTAPRVPAPATTTAPRTL